MTHNLSNFLQLGQNRDHIGSPTKRGRLHNLTFTLTADRHPEQLQQQPQQCQRSKWEEFTEHESQYADDSRSPVASSYTCNASAASPEDIPLQTDHRGPVVATISLGMEPSLSRCADKQYGEVEASHDVNNEVCGVTGMLPDTPRPPGSVQAPNCPIQGRPTGQTSYTAPSLTVPSLRKRKGFTAPAMVPGHQQSQHQASRPCVQQSKLSAEMAPCVHHRPAIVFCGPCAEPVQRHMAIPTYFASLQAYKQTWCAAVTEELNIR